MAEPSRESESIQPPTQDPSRSPGPSPLGEPDQAALDEPLAQGGVHVVGIPTPATESDSLRSPEEAPERQEEAVARIDPFQGLRRGLTEKEWNSAGTRILFLDRLDQLETEIKELKEYRSRYYEKDKEAAVQREKLRQLETADKLLDFCLGAGGVLIGLGTFFLDKGQGVPGLVAGLAGVVLLGWPLWQKYHPRSA